MALKTLRWDSAALLQSDADIADYLAACLEEAPDDAAFLTHALGIAARARNMSQLARSCGITREGLYKALSGEGNPSFATVLKVITALGYRIALIPLAGKPVPRKKAVAARATGKTATKVATKAKPRPRASSTRRGS